MTLGGTRRIERLDGAWRAPNDGDEPEPPKRALDRDATARADRRARPSDGRRPLRIAEPSRKSWRAKSHLTAPSIGYEFLPGCSRRAPAG